MKAPLLVLILTIFSTQFLSANITNEKSPDEYSITHYTIADGIASNNVLSITQDEYGFIWLATVAGVNKYEGKRFIHYKQGDDNISLTNNYTQHLIGDKDKNIWIASSDGLNIYSYETDSIQKIKKENAKGYLSSSDIMCFSTMKNGKGIWIATYDNGLNYYDYERGSFHKFDLPGILNSSFITSMYEDSRYNLWIGTLNNGTYLYSTSTKETHHFLTERVHHITEDSQGNIWISAASLYYYNGKEKRLTPIEFHDQKYRYIVRCVAEDKKGNLWVGGGNVLGYFSLNEMEKKKKVELTEVKQQGYNWGNSFMAIMSLYIDKEDDVWIGTYGDGVYHISNDITTFKFFKYNPFDKNSLSGIKSQSITNDKNGNILVCVEGKGIDVFNPQYKRIKSYTNIKNGNNFIITPFIGSILNDSSGNLWIGTFWDGVNIVKEDNSTLHLTTTDGLPSNVIRDIREGMNGLIWIGTEEGPCYFKDGKIHNNFSLFTEKRYDTRSICQTSDSIVWLGTYGDGLICYDIKNNTLKSYEAPDKDPKNYIYQIKAHNDSLCISIRNGGIHFFSISQNRYIGYRNKSNGAISNEFPTFEIDSNGNIWAASTEGISHITPDTVMIFTSKDGVQENEFFGSCKYTDKNGNTKYYFSGYEGINIIDDNYETKSASPAPVFINSLRLFGQNIRPYQEVPYGNPLTKNIIQTDHIKLSYKQSTFVIGFISPHYKENKQTEYSYILEGTDANWNDLDQQQEITFRDLKAGNYLLKIKEKNAPDIAAQLAITVRPPFWKTAPAYLIYFLVVTGLLYLSWDYSTKQIRTQHKLKLEKSERMKEEEIYQAKLRFFTNISHEIRTPLTLILAPLESMDQHKFPEIQQSLELITRNARKLLQLVNQLLDFRKSELGKMKIKVQYGNLTQFIQQISSSFESLKNEKNINFTFISSPANLTGWFDSDFIEKIMFNLLSNAYKFTEHKGEITIELRLINSNNQNIAQLNVKDTGRGIPKDELRFIFERFYQSNTIIDKNKQGTGIGLHLVNSLIKLHHGTIQVESHVNKGTTFTVEFPIDQSAYKEEELYMNEPVQEQEKDLPSELPEVSSSKVAEHEDRTRILVVDDDQDMRSYLDALLSSRYHIITANSGKEALTLLKQYECDMVISDVMMDNIDGIELCKQIKTNIETSHIPVILLTAKSSMESEIEGLENGADSYITKPFHFQHLFARIDNLIESRKVFKNKFTNPEGYKVLHIESQSIDDKLMQQITDYISKNLSDTEMNGDKIAKEVNLSRMTLHRKLKSLTGHSSSEFIRIIRLKEAAYQIENTNKNISDICYEVGFNAPSYFTSCFTKYFKETPTEYLKRKRGQITNSKTFNTFTE